MATYQAPKINNVPNTNDVATLRQYVKELANAVALMSKDLDFIVNGQIDSGNVREIGGYNVDKTDLKSKDGTVGISSYSAGDETIDDTRFWAGSADKDTAPWRVTRKGVMNSTGARIASKDGYPRVEMDPENNLFVAYFDADNYIRIVADFGGAPAIEFYTTGILRGRFSTLLGGIQVDSPYGTNLDGLNRFQDWTKIYNATSGKTLKAELDSLSTRLTAGGL